MRLVIFPLHHSELIELQSIHELKPLSLLSGNWHLLWVACTLLPSTIEQKKVLSLNFPAECRLKNVPASFRQNSSCYFQGPTSRTSWETNQGLQIASAVTLFKHPSRKLCSRWTPQTFHLPTSVYTFSLREFQDLLRKTFRNPAASCESRTLSPQSSQSCEAKTTQKPATCNPENRSRSHLEFHVSPSVPKILLRPTKRFLRSSPGYALRTSREHVTEILGNLLRVMG